MLEHATDRRRLLAALAATGVAAPLAAGAASAQTSSAALRAGALNLREFGAIGDGRADDTGALLRAVAAIAAAPSGGALYVPAGSYRLTREILLPRGITLFGDGPVTSRLVWDHLGHGLRKVEPINGSHNVFVTIEKLAISNTAGAANRGAGFYDTCGTQIVVRECWIAGWQYSIILDQSELVDIDLCEFSAPHHSGIWLVNGPDLTRGAAGGFTNRISVSRCQINGSGRYGILDDGGYAHAFIDNNYNSGRNHIRAAGVSGFNIRGGEFEGASEANIVLTFNTLGGRGVGQSAAVFIQGAAIAPSAGNSAIAIDGVGYLTLVGNGFGNTGNPSVPLVRGMANCAAFFSAGNAFFESVGPFLERRASAVHVMTEGTREASASFPGGRIGSGDSAFANAAIQDVDFNSHVESVAPSADLGDEVTVTARIARPGLVRVKLHNTSGRAVDVPRCTISVRVWRG